MTYNIESADLHAQPTMVVRGTVATGHLEEFFRNAFTQVAEVVTRDGLDFAGAPFARYHSTEEGIWGVEGGFPVAEQGAAHGEVAPSHLPAGPVLRTVHVGPWGELGQAHEALTSWAADHRLTPAGDPWEVYLDGPEVAQPRTEVVLPVRAVRPDPTGDPLGGATHPDRGRS